MFFSSFLKSNKSLKSHYIIVDEAHQILAQIHKKELYQLTRKNTAHVLGLITTPRSGIDNEQNKLSAELFHKKIIQIELYGKDGDYHENNVIKYLEDEETLAEVKCKPLHTNVKYDLTKK